MGQSATCDSPHRLPWQDRFAIGPRSKVEQPNSATRFTALATVVAAVMLALTVAWTDARLQQHLLARGAEVELIYLPPARFLKMVSVGYQHALADVLWFRTISYFGHHYRRDRVYPWLAYMCDVVTDLDPRAEHVYRFGGFILPWEAERVDDGIALLEKGTRNLPESWELWYILGFSYYFFKDDLASASRALRHSMLLPDAPEFVSRLVAVVDAAEHGPNSAIEFLAAAAQRATNLEVRAALEQRIRELVLTRDIEALEAAVDMFGKAVGRPPVDLGELVTAGVIPVIPPEPFGGQYLLDREAGHVRSSLGHQTRRLGSSRQRESFLKQRTGD